MTNIKENRFEIGGEVLLAFNQGEFAPDGAATKEGAVKQSESKELDDIRVRVGTLLKAEMVSFLLGAGASVDCGGQLIGTVPLVVEHDLLSEGVHGMRRPRVCKWLDLFYRAVYCAGASDSPLTRDAILARRAVLAGENIEPLKASFEQVLAMLHRWHSALPESGGRLRTEGSASVDARAEDLEKAIHRATRALALSCVLPVANNETGLAIYNTFLRKVLTRPLNLKRVNIFTLNYDTLIEQAADAEGVVLLDGFVGTQRRIFRPESYEQDLYFPAETTEGRVHRFDRVLHLYKLHGSITWTASEPTIDNPYGIESIAFGRDEAKRVLIYPTPAKYGETLGMPYADLFRRFVATLVRPQSVLFVIGYGFGDEHVNAIIRQALAVPSFTLVIVDPDPKSDFVKKLREQQDLRLWITEGPRIGTFAGFVKDILPDLRDEEIRKKVLATHRALEKGSQGSGGETGGE